MKQEIKNLRAGNKETIQIFIKRYMSAYHKFDNLFTNNIDEVKDKIREIRATNNDIKIKVVIGSIHQEDHQRLNRLI